MKKYILHNCLKYEIVGCLMRYVGYDKYLFISLSYKNKIVGSCEFRVSFDTQKIQLIHCGITDYDLLDCLIEYVDMKCFE